MIFCFNALTSVGSKTLMDTSKIFKLQHDSSVFWDLTFEAPVILLRHYVHTSLVHCGSYALNILMDNKDSVSIDSHYL